MKKFEWLSFECYFRKKVATCAIKEGHVTTLSLLPATDNKNIVCNQDALFWPDVKVIADGQIGNGSLGKFVSKQQTFRRVVF